MILELSEYCLTFHEAIDDVMVLFSEITYFSAIKCFGVNSERSHSLVWLFPDEFLFQEYFSSSLLLGDKIKAAPPLMLFFTSLCVA